MTDAEDYQQLKKDEKKVLEKLRNEKSLEKRKN